MIVADERSDRNRRVDLSRRSDLSRRVDRERSEVYAAELMAFDGTDLEGVEPFDTVSAFTSGIVSGPWWPAAPVEVRRSRVDARSSTTRRSASAPGRVEIRLAATQMTRATAVHELAHALAGPVAGHGPLFRRAHVDIARAAFGDERAAWLHDAYRSAGLLLDERRWPEPPDGGGAIAL